MKEQPYCPECGGENVLVDAWAEWDTDRQEWVLNNTFDDYFCQDCDGPIYPKWKQTP